MLCRADGVPDLSKTTSLGSKIWVSERWDKGIMLYSANLILWEFMKSVKMFILLDARKIQKQVKYVIIWRRHTVA
jgi:hypothetical protein